MAPLYAALAQKIWRRNRVMKPAPDTITPLCEGWPNDQQVYESYSYFCAIVFFGE